MTKAQTLYKIDTTISQMLHTYAGLTKQDVQPAKRIAGKMIQAAAKDETLMNGLLDWSEFSASTIELRRMAKTVGFDYWANLDTANALDALDAAQARAQS